MVSAIYGEKHRVHSNKQLFTVLPMQTYLLHHTPSFFEIAGIKLGNGLRLFL
jgi:hypothetical protein